jgi:hypothetical protein
MSHVDLAGRIQKVLALAFAGTIVAGALLVPSPRAHALPCTSTTPQDAGALEVSRVTLSEAFGYGNTQAEQPAPSPFAWGRPESQKEPVTASDPSPFAWGRPESQKEPAIVTGLSPRGEMQDRAGNLSMSPWRQSQTVAPDQLAALDQQATCGVEQ